MMLDGLIPPTKPPGEVTIKRLADVLHCRGLRRQPVAVDYPVDDRLPKRSQRDHADLAVSEPVGHMERGIGGFASPFGLMDLLKERTRAADPVAAVPAGDVAAYVIDADVGGSHEEQAAGVGEPAFAVSEVQPPDQVGRRGLGQLEVRRASPQSQVAARQFHGNRPDILQRMARRQLGPVESAAMQPS